MNKISIDTSKLKEWSKYFNSVDTEYIGINFKEQAIVVVGDSGNILSFSNTNFSSNDEMPNKFFVFDKAEFINLFTTYNDLSILIDEDKQHSYIGDNYGKGILKRVDALASTYLDAFGLFNNEKETIELFDITESFKDSLKKAFFFVDINSNKAGYRVAIVCEDTIVGASNNRIFKKTLDSINIGEIDFAIDKEAFKIICDIPNLTITYEASENINSYFMENDDIKIYYKTPRVDKESSISHFVRDERATSMMNSLRNNSFDISLSDIEKALKFMSFYCGKVAINPNNQCLVTLDFESNTMMFDYDDQNYSIVLADNTYDENQESIVFKTNVVYLLQILSRFSKADEKGNITIFENAGEKPNMIMLNPLKGEEIYIPKLAKV